MTTLPKSAFRQPDSLRSVAEFHRLFRQPILENPTIPKDERSKLRLSLLQEEIKELEEAVAQKDLIEVADAFADIQYVLSGAILEFGMRSIFKDLFDEVQRSNMSKTCKSLEEAEATRRHYKETKGHDSTIEERKVESDSVEKSGGTEGTEEPPKKKQCQFKTEWLVYRTGDRKALKSINYSPAKLGPILDKKVQNAGDDAKESSIMEPDALNAVVKFHRMFSCPVLPSPILPSAERSKLRISLLKEEVGELEEAIKANDIVEVADAFADIQYVLSGAILEFGMGKEFASLFDEVHRSNMSKACANAEEAELTRSHYKTKNGHDSTIEQVVLDSDDTTKSVSEKNNKWLVYRSPDRKVLKSINYSPAKLVPLLGF